MVFSSPFFLALFFPCLLIGYLLAWRMRNFVLFAASIFFYGWGEPRALPVMLFIIALNYYAAILLERGNKKIILTVALALNVLCLTYFKYLDFLVENLNALLAVLNMEPLPLPNIVLPIGISFYIFQALSYVIDVFRGRVAAQKSMFRFALYISLFPQLIAGPIVRYASVAGELENRRLIPQNIHDGMARFCIGLAKKIFLADSMGLVADNVFGAPAGTIPALFAWLGALAYALQIYYDFSAYSDMAIGIGRMFNFHFPENFNFPYAATSIRDFWRRWHMSLTAWLTDYIYIPLGGSHCSALRTYRNILIVLLICGIWHGAAWNFVFWGLYNGLGLIIERALPQGQSDGRQWLRACLRRVLTLVFVLVGWVIFRSPDAAYALDYIRVMFTGNPEYDIFSFAPLWINCFTISNAIFLVLGLILSQPIRLFSWQKLSGSPAGQLWLLVLFAVTYAFALTSDYSPFLYFRF